MLVFLRCFAFCFLRRVPVLVPVSVSVCCMCARVVLSVSVSVVCGVLWEGGVRGAFALVFFPRAPHRHHPPALHLHAAVVCST